MFKQSYLPLLALPQKDLCFCQLTWHFLDLWQIFSVSILHIYQLIKQSNKILWWKPGPRYWFRPYPPLFVRKLIAENKMIFINIFSIEKKIQSENLNFFMTKIGLFSLFSHALTVQLKQCKINPEMIAVLRKGCVLIFKNVRSEFLKIGWYSYLRNHVVKCP